MIIELGNAAAIGAYRDSEGELQHEDYDGERVTTVNLPDDYTMSMAFLCVTAPDGVWTHHSRVDPETGRPVPPAWVESDKDGLAALIAENFGCPVGRPDGWGADLETTDEETPA